MIFLAATFAISWIAWTPLVLFPFFANGSRPGLSLILFGFGGLGPTIAAYAAVIATRRHRPLGEFHARLLRWRLRPRWYAAALGLPLLLVGAGAALTLALVPAWREVLETLRPWWSWPVLLPLMVLGGGLEELGWRGVLLEECGDTSVLSAVFVGVIWSVWHLPLFRFAIGGHDLPYAWFAVETIGLALILAWLYWHTRSILLCVLLHAGFNATMAMGFGGGTFTMVLAIGAAALGLVLLRCFPPPIVNAAISRG